MPSEKKRHEEMERQMNPSNMAGASRLLRQGPEAVERAISEGLGKIKATPDPTYDDTRRRQRK